MTKSTQIEYDSEVAKVEVARHVEIHSLNAKVNVPP